MSSFTFQIFDEVTNELWENPMHLTNHTVKRAFIKDSVLCAVIRDGIVLAMQEHANFDGAEWAKQAFAKFGKCRVMFHATSAAIWREVRWKNANVGTMYRRPSFMTVSVEDVPAELRMAALIHG